MAANTFKEAFQFPSLTLRGRKIHIRLINASDREALVRLLEEHFFTDDPCDAALLRTWAEKHGADEMKRTVKASAERYTDIPLSGIINMSLLAIVDDGPIIGVAYGLLEKNGVLQTTIPYIQPSAQEMAVYESHYERCGRLLAEAKKRTFEKTGVIESVVDRVRTLCVHRDWRGCGLASALIRAREQLAKERGCGLQLVLASSAYSQRAYAHAGFEVMAEDSFVDFFKEIQVKYVVGDSAPSTMQLLAHRLC